MNNSWELSPELVQKRDQLLIMLSQIGRVVVAFSAGVDSTVLAKAAQLACSPHATAVLALSPSVPIGTHHQAEQLANQIGIPFKTINTTEFHNPAYVANSGNRCYFCKQNLYESILAIGHSCPHDVIVNGTNTDDLGDYRPGLQAAQEYNVRSPFVEAGLTKTEIRLLARHWNLPVWDQPSSPCLSSRIAHHLEVTPERVARVDQAEQYLKKLLDCQELRVRHEFHDLARIELPPDLIPIACQAEIRLQIEQQLRGLGFKYVTIDLAAFRSGSMNVVLPLNVLKQNS